MNNDRVEWIIRTAFGILFYCICAVLAMAIVWWLGGNPLSLVSFIPFLFGYLAGRVSKGIEK